MLYKFLFVGLLTLALNSRLLGLFKNKIICGQATGKVLDAKDWAAIK
jgi:hypothetical protein